MAPRYMIRDRDGKYGDYFTKRVMGMRKDDIYQCTRDLVLIERGRDWLQPLDRLDDARSGNKINNELHSLFTPSRIDPFAVF